MNISTNRKKPLKKASSPKAAAKKRSTAVIEGMTKTAKKPTHSKTVVKSKRQERNFSAQKTTARKKSASAGGKTSKAVSGKQKEPEKKTATVKTASKKPSPKSEKKPTKSAAAKTPISGRKGAVAKTEKKTAAPASGKQRGAGKKSATTKTAPKTTRARSRLKTTTKEKEGAPVEISVPSKKPSVKTAAAKTKKAGPTAVKTAASEWSAVKPAAAAVKKTRKTVEKGVVTRTSVETMKRKTDTSAVDKTKQAAVKGKETSKKSITAKTKATGEREIVPQAVPLKVTEKPEPGAASPKPAKKKIEAKGAASAQAIEEERIKPVIEGKRDEVLPETKQALIQKAEPVVHGRKLRKSPALHTRPEEKSASGSQRRMTDQHPEQPSRAGLKIFLPGPDVIEEADHDVYPLQLPDEYGENSLFVVAVDPDTVFVDWEMVPRDIAGEEGDLILRFYDITGNEDRRDIFFDLRIDERVGNGFYHILMPGRDVIVEAGIKSPRGIFISVVRSGVVHFPALLKHDDLGIAQKLSESGIRVGY